MMRLKDETDYIHSLSLTQGKTTSKKSERALSGEVNPASNFNFDFIASRTIRNKFMLF